MSATREDLAPFDLASPLPPGITLLEASAGTGKTFTIAALVTRLVALEDVRLPRVLAVTFTRAATAELRDRVRRQLVDAAAHLDRVLAGCPPDTGHPVLDLVAAPGNGEDELRVRRRRLGTALAEFDAATIATIHGFCQHVLAGIGIAGDVDRGAVLVEDHRDLLEACVDDCYLRAFHAADGAALPLRRSELLAIAEKVAGNPGVAIVPEHAAEEAVRWRVRLAHAVRDELERRKRTTGLLSYDDLLTRLAATLADARYGGAAGARLRSLYDVALIDEFQDTDPIQWDILERAFAAPGRRLVLIGDPKQAIYAFRGADVYAYLRGAAAAGELRTLATNWRSDAGLLEACNVFFDNAALGDSAIRYRPVRAAPPHQAPRLFAAPEAAPLRLRIVRRDADVRLGGGARPTIVASSARAFIARDVAAETVRLLASEAAIVERDLDGRGAPPRPVEPRDLAVLVRTNAEAVLVQRALREADVPAVINGVGSVFATPAASDWLHFLEALERPAAPARARAAALTPFLGWSAAEVADAGEEALAGVHDRLHGWAALVRDRSVAALLRAVLVAERVPERLLARDDGDRLLTDLEHIGELLHAAASAEQLGTTALAGWLRDRIAESAEDVTSDERARRLESDADAVQVLTIHRAKGLEFPIVFCPFLWSPGLVDKAVPLFHDDAGRRLVDVGGDGEREELAEHRSRSEKEQHGESLRLLYVAVTRARHQAVLWWAPGGGSWRSPLARMLFCRTARGVRTQGNPTLPDDDTTVERLEELAEPASGMIGVEQAPPHPEPGVWAARVRAPGGLERARFDRSLDYEWRRTSYSALTRAVEDPPAASEPDEAVVDDEPAVASPSPDAGADEAALRAVASPLDTLRGGTEFGTLVHAVLEDIDFGVADPGLRAAVDRHLQRRHVDVDAAVLAAGLRRVLATPLGPLAGESALADFPRADRLDELAFELPLAGGHTPRAELTLGALAALLRARLPSGDPLAGYPDRLADPALRRDLRGYLTGAIDCVLRLPDGRFVVVDYKTNRLAPADEPLTAFHYRPAALAEAMVRGHYPLQALLYAVALHRYLRWRLQGYDPEAHLAGFAYLFVRGMTGPAVPRVGGQPCGVFAWTPPPGLVPDLSDLLAAGTVRAA